MYEYLASSWLFNPAHFGARLAEPDYYERLEDRSPHWTYFIKEWVPARYPGYMFRKQYASPDETANMTQKNQIEVLGLWYKRTRAVLREKVFTMFPHIATAYYTKRAAHVKELEEQRLRALITAAIPSADNGWTDNVPHPQIVIKHDKSLPSTPRLKPIVVGELTPPLTPTDEVFRENMTPFDFTIPAVAGTKLPERLKEPWDVPLHLEPLPRTPGHGCTPQPPPASFPLDKRLLCLARWTLFDPSNGKPYLLPAPREKDFEMQWTELTYAGATDEDLTSWAKRIWWPIWIRQCYVNYVGMWKKRFEKEDQKAEKKRLEDEARQKAEEAVKQNRERVMGRLKMINVNLGLIGGDASGA